MVAVAALAALLAAVWLWYSHLGAREAANLAAMAFCRSKNLQFLDGTVAFARLGIARGRRRRLVVRRLFSFEFSIDGVNRLGGIVTVEGRRVTAVDPPPVMTH